MERQKYKTRDVIIAVVFLILGFTIGFAFGMAHAISLMADKISLVLNQNHTAEDLVRLIEKYLNR